MALLQHRISLRRHKIDVNEELAMKNLCSARYAVLTAVAVVALLGGCKRGGQHLRRDLAVDLELEPLALAHAGELRAA